MCDNRGDGAAVGRNSHSSSCCGSTICSPTRYKAQQESWLTAEKLWRRAAVLWLLAELLHQQVQEWLAAEQRHSADCEVWLAAETRFRLSIRARAVKRVRVAAAPATPQTAKQRAHAR